MSYQRTSINMVQVVRNIIDGYRMGAIRALAQDPVQNSLDAKNARRVCVEYRLHKRSRQYLLTVTDTGTTGLRGPILTAEEIEKRGSRLTREENWAAFEGQGYTKEGEDALGSRGQGKAAFLYHSEPPKHPTSGAQRMIMLYDTLLADGEYRLGERYASPTDRTKEPQTGSSARAAVRSSTYQVGDDLKIPLELDPLSQIGTRVIVPFLSKKAIKAIKSGELSHWLQRCWWRVIQIGDLDLRVVDEKDNTTKIHLPAWWTDEPWRKFPRPENLLVDENVSLLEEEPDFAIKRVVLRYSPEWTDDEINSDPQAPEYVGVQLLRHGQWIQTLGAGKDFGDHIPQDRRPGFRGFVEFKKSLDKRLRGSEYENPQHDNFSRRTLLVRSIDEKIKGAVRRFSTQMGWHAEQDEPDARTPGQEIEFAQKFVSTFMTAQKKRGSRGGTTGAWWSCRLHVDYPQQGIARVDWGESIHNIYADVKVENREHLPPVQVNLHLISKGGEETLIETVTAQSPHLENTGKAQFGDVQFIRGNPAKPRQVRAPAPGLYHLRATVVENDDAVTQSRAQVFVAEDPPEPLPARDYTLGIKVDNLTREGQRRINSGDEVLIRLYATNRTTAPKKFMFNMALGDGQHDYQLANGVVQTVPGIAKGGALERVEIISLRRKISTREGAASDVLRLNAGRRYIRGDMFLESGTEEVVANTQQIVYIEVNPGRPQTGMPFEIRRRDKAGIFPMWELTENQGEYILWYSAQTPIYREIKDMQRPGVTLAGKNAFVAEICANGLLEWAKEDGSNFHDLMDPPWLNFDPELQDRFNRRLQEIHSGEQPYGKAWRDAVAIMLYAFENSRG